MAADPDLPPVFTRHDALDRGTTRHQLEHRLRSGRWVRLCRGAYAVRSSFDRRPPAERHLLRAVATTLIRADACTVSHVSAAAVHGWPLPLTPPESAWLTRADLSRSARHQRYAVVQVATLPTADVCQRTVHVDAACWPVQVTSPARTVADCLRHLPLADAVAVGDAALRSGAADHESVSAVLRRQTPWPYLERGVHALHQLDPRRESWLESVSAVVVARLGGPTYEPQVSVLDEQGAFVARVDGWLDEGTVAVEIDGRDKLLPDLRAARDDPRAVALSVRQAMEAQHRRELALRRLGVEVVRWGTADVLRRPYRVVQQLRSAQASRGGVRLRGSVLRQTAPGWLDLPACARRPGFSGSEAG